jgi:hypothetical protein
VPRVKRIAGFSGVPSPLVHGEGQRRHRSWTETMIELPGVREAACQEGMSSESQEPLVGR